MGSDSGLNANDRLLLWLAGKFRVVLKALGIDADTYQLLLETRLRTTRRWRQKDQAVGSGIRLGTLGMALLVAGYVKFGVILAIALHFVEFEFFVVILSGAILLLVGLPAGLELSTALFEGGDLQVLAPFPVKTRTIIAVKLTQISYFTAWLALILSAPSIISGIYPYPWFYVPLMILVVALTTLIVLSILLLIFVLVLRIVDVSQFKDAIVWTQVTAFLAMVSGPQLLNALVMGSPLPDVLRSHPTLALFFPPAHFGGLAAFLGGMRDPLTTQLALAALVFTPVLIVILRLCTGQTLMSKLIALDSEEGSLRSAKPSRLGISGRLARYFVAQGSSRAGYDFLLQNIGRDRVFKMQVLPGLIVLPVSMLPALIFTREWVPVSAALPFLSFMCPFAILAVVQQSVFSSHWEARWIFDGLDDERRSRFMTGALRAGLVKCAVVPLAMMLPLFYLASPSQLAAPLLAVGLALSSCFAIAPRLIEDMPFTRRFDPMMATAEKVGIGLLGMLIIALASALQAGLHFIPYGHAVALLLLLPLLYRQTQSFRRLQLTAPPLVRGDE